jgi:O-antigen/teichoic acid export membrane protein
VTKLWIFSGSLMGVLFPRFSIMTDDHEGMQRLYRQALVSLALCTTPAAGLIVTFAPEFFQVWLGPEIAREAVTVARWLTIGVLLNVIAQVPYTVLQATGHADATGKLQMIELPLYAVAAWFGAVHWGVAGVAVAWTSRAALDALLMFAAATRRLGSIHGRGAPMTAALVTCASALFMIWCWQGVPLLGPAIIPKALVACISIGAFMYLVSRSLDVRVSHAALLLRS